MKRARPLLLVALTLALFISACSQPADIQVPSLEPQFGTANNDYGRNVAVNTEGIYVGGEWNSKPVLVKFTRDGRIPWLREIGPQPGDEHSNVWDVALAPSGHAYALYASIESRPGGPDDGNTNFYTYYLRKYAPDAKLVWERRLTGASNSYSAVKVDVDKSNNLYVAFGGAEQGLRKYNAGGALLWQAPGRFNAMTVSPNGFSFTIAQVAGVDKLTRYHPNGMVLWSKTVPFITIEVALGRESEVYVAGVNPSAPGDLTKDAQLTSYTARGDKLWQRTIRGNNGEDARPQTLAADAQGNAYIAANTYEVETNKSISFTQRYSASGMKVWSYQLVIASPSDVTMTDVAAVSPSEVYVVGATTTKVNGINNGEADGFVLRLNGQGKKVWSR